MMNNDFDTIYSVSDITSGIKNLLEMHFKSVKVTGEISNFRPASSGHWYFQLGDKNATISIVMFKSRSFRVPFSPKDGDKVVISGSVSVYPPRGGYQIIAETMSLSGTGDILALIEKRKQHFASLGYFDPSRKRPIPQFPKKIGVVTSDTGAAIRDIIHVLSRRNKSVKVVIFPTLVQGDKAGEMISKRIAQAQRMEDLDVLIVTRGGGSLEDLLPFSEASVIEALYSSRIPTISAVGHEIDNALSDYVADLRAPTPSAAAEIVSGSYDTIFSQLKNLKVDMVSSISQKMALAKSTFKQYDIDLLYDKVKQRIKDTRLYVDDHHNQQTREIQLKMSNLKKDLRTYKETLYALSPYNILERGYSIVTLKGDNQPLSAASAVDKGDEISITFNHGSAQATISEVSKGKKE